MDQSVFLVLDFSAVCRLCLSGRLLSDIYEEQESSTELDAPPLRDQIALITGVQIFEEDSLPQRICYKCRYLVDVAYELRASAVRTEGLLTHALADATPKDAENIQQIDIKDEEFEFLEQPEPGDTRTGDIVDNREQIDNKDKLSGYLEQPAPNDTHTRDDHDLKDFSEPGDGDISNSEQLDNAEYDILTFEDNETGDSFVIEEMKDMTDEPITTKTKCENASAPYVSTKIASKKSPPMKLGKKRKNLCEICLTTFPSRSALIAHVREHYADSPLTPYPEVPRPLRCEECERPVSGRVELVQHHLQHLDLNPFVCRKAGCSYVGKNKDALRHHSYRHRAHTFVCENCGATFCRQWELTQHAIRHTDEGERFPCRLCRVVCRNRITLRTHLKWHEWGRRHKCDRLGCPKAFFTRTELTSHLRSHDNIRTFRCHLCVSAYVTQSQLNRHLRQHEKRRQHKCDKCEAMFDNYSEYFNHRIGTHGPFQPVKCIGCNQGYQSEPHLQRHMIRCKLAQNLKELLPEGSPLAVPADPKELCTEASSPEALDALLAPELEACPAPVDGDARHAKAHQETAPDGLAYAEVDDMSMQSYPSPAISPAAPLQRQQ